MDGQLPPNGVIGIVGGGQLGRMSAMAAARLGYRCHVLPPEADSPASQVSARTFLGDYEDPAPPRPGSPSAAGPTCMPRWRASGCPVC